MFTICYALQCKKLLKLQIKILTLLVKNDRDVLLERDCMQLLSVLTKTLRSSIGLIFEKHLMLEIETVR